MYIRRHLEPTIQRLAEQYAAVLVTGARQTGKTTLLRRAFPSTPYLTFDNSVTLELAKRDPRLFLESREQPLAIDEVQYAPELFPWMKIAIDEANIEHALHGGGAPRGRFLLTGSQRFTMMRNVSESLAGRIGIAQLLGLSLREIAGDAFATPFVPDAAYRLARRASAPERLTPARLWEIIVRGSMPELHARTELDPATYHGLYLNTYLERDVRNLTQVGDLLSFRTFMVALAARTGGLLNLSAVASDVGISVPTAKRWLSVLEASQVVYLLRPYHANVTKRVVKTPKLYFHDTGLAAHLTGWTTPEVLQNGAMAGTFFETFVIGEILKSYHNSGVLDPPLFFYRDQQKNEIDLLILKDGHLHPIEIKKSAQPRQSDLQGFKQLEQFAALGIRRGEGALICLHDEALPLQEGDWALPVEYI